LEEPGAGFLIFGDDYLSRKPLADRPRVDHQCSPKFVDTTSFVYMGTKMDCRLFLLDILSDTFASNVDAFLGIVEFCFVGRGMGHKYPFSALAKGESC